MSVGTYECQSEKNIQTVPALPVVLSQRRQLTAGQTLLVGSNAYLPIQNLFEIPLVPKNFQNNVEDTVQEKTELFVDNKQKLITKCSSDSSWLSNLTLAEDVHSEKGRLSLSFGGDSSPLQFQAQLTISQTLRRGDVLPVWFASELASHLGLPFLNFSHIKGGSYSCEMCGKIFSAPNPLKLHIASLCDSLSSDDLWSRAMRTICKQFVIPVYSDCGIISSRNRSYQISVESNQCPISAVLPEPLIHEVNGRRECKEKSVSPDSTCTNTIHSLDNNLKNILEHNLSSNKQLNTRVNSAFRPVQGRGNPFLLHNDFNISGPKFPDNIYHNYLSLFKQNSFLTMNNTSSFLPSLIPQQNSFWAADRSSNNLRPQIPFRNGLISSLNPELSPLKTLEFPTIPSNTSSLNSESFAEIEVLVSNLGKSKGRHICIYCGKAYSRKYGLKIHTRTHTGYKPLKCRVCFRPFGDPSNLNKHIRLHAQGDTPYRCGYCGKVLVRRRDLDRHIKSRHAESTPLKPRKETNDLIKVKLEETNCEVGKIPI